MSNEPSPDDSGRMPRWVRVFGVIALLFVLTVLVLHITGHGFGGHMHQ